MALDRFTRNSIFGMIAGLNAAFGSFLGMVIVARMLGPVGSGAVSIGVWLAGAAVTFADIGLPLTVSRFLPELHAREQHAAAKAFGPHFFYPVLLTTALGAALFAALGLGGASWLRAHIRLGFLADSPDSMWLIVGLVFVAQAIGNFGLANLRGEQRFDVAAKLTGFGLPVQLIAMAFGAQIAAAPGALLGYATGALVTAGAALTLLRRPAPLPDALRRRAWTFARNSWVVGMISTIVWSRVELGFLDYWRGAREAGLYAAAFTLCTLAIQGPLLMTGGLLPHFAERHALDDRPGLCESYASAVRFMGLLIFPACFGTAAITPVLLPLLFGREFVDAAPAATILVATQAVGALSTVSSTFLMSVERADFLVRIGLVGVALALFAGVTVIPAFGVEGAVLSRAVVQGALTTVAFVYIATRLKCAFPLGAILRIAAAALGCALVARGVIVLWPHPLALAPAILAAALVFAALTLLFGALQPRDLALVKTLARKFLTRTTPF